MSLLFTGVNTCIYICIYVTIMHPQEVHEIPNWIIFLFAGVNIYVNTCIMYVSCSLLVITHKFVCRSEQSLHKRKLCLQEIT